MSILTECREKKRMKAIRARRRSLEKLHNNIIEWMTCLDDNIVLGNDEEAKDFINQLNAYIEKLAILVGERQQRRLSRSALHVKKRQ